ncbi:hypothetical protein C2S52_009103 [Perilla frutescens var. hirtella]|nr:hypothetical protein C2S52_009103 [Perilla frutescens var. hirtella]
MEAATEGAAETAVPYQNKDLIVKGKRTKRQRHNSPLSFTITRNTAAAHNHHLPPRSPASYAASSEESTTTEEADTARCLILLSRGHFPTNPYNNNRHSEAATTSYGGAASGACMYTCKTCNRSFSSFQALGGHRASHKKPKNEKKSAIFSDEEDFLSPSSSKNKFSPNSLSLQLSCSVSTTTTFSATLKSSPSPRIHECSYCGAEFTSGQALGGHMRKHRGAGPINRLLNIPAEEIAFDDEVVELEETNKAGNWLSLDLNLPAPEDEREKSPSPTCPPLLLHH